MHGLATGCCVNARFWEPFFQKTCETSLKLHPMRALEPRFDLSANGNVLLNRIPKLPNNLTPGQQRAFTHRSDQAEWASMEEHHVFRVLSQAAGRKVEEREGDRVMGCRFVRDWRKADGVNLEDLNKEQRKVYAWTGGRLWKAKFCLAAQGHQGPDLLLKVESGKLNSPTVQ